MDLNMTSTILADTQNWFTAFFGAEGFVTLNVTNQVIAPVDEEEASGEEPVPHGLDAIVEWIKI